MTTGDPYPSPSHISYAESSRWCQEHGHTGLLVGSVCRTCDQLVTSDPRFAAVLGTEHNPDGSRVTGTGGADRPRLATRPGMADDDSGGLAAPIARPGSPGRRAPGPARP